MTAHYISASRRTDIPGFFCDEFFAAWKKGEITYDGGYGRAYTVSLRPEDVLGYIFWSKDFSPLIGHPLFPALLAQSNAIFHFTINDCPSLEPNVPSLDARIKTLRALCNIVGPQRVLWRFDPICKWESAGNRVETNFASFFTILPQMQRAGITRCYYSFMTRYSKLKQRGVMFEDFTAEEREEMSRQLLAGAEGAGMKLYNCCNPDVLEMVPRILQAHCIDDDLLRQTDRFGVHPTLSLKPSRQGCGCYESRDIGSYAQRCGHRCLYCYANPA